MVDTHKVKRRIWQLHRIKTWQLVLILIPLLFVSATLLRLNNLGMVERLDTVLAADERGDQAAIERSLVALQHYVSSRMNTSLGNGFYLEHTYERDRDAALEAASQQDSPQSDAHQQASVECQERFRGSVESFRNDYVQCVVERVSALGAGEDATANLNLPTASEYHYNFRSPAWSPDLAGWSLVLCALIVLVIVVRLVMLGVLHALLRYHFRVQKM